MMYIGIDLGTSSTKIILIDDNNNTLYEKSKDYPLYFPFEGWSEQNPEDWLKVIKEMLNEISFKYGDKIKGVSICGQMHGLVILDENDNVIRPAILWNDARCQKETNYLNDIITKKLLNNETGNIAYAGFTAPKLLWLKENEPDNFNRIKKIMLPKDYIIYKLTGVHSCDYSDASGTLFYDVKNKCWSKTMCEICNIKPEWLPTLYNSFEVVGKCKDEFNLNNAIVTAGAGDNASAAIGTGTVEEGYCNISLGTSGTVFICKDSFTQLNNNDLHSFNDATGKYHLMGCILSAAKCNEWWKKDILNEKVSNFDNLDNLLGNNNIFFLPYLIGERSPHNDTDIRGAFFGLSINTTKNELDLAILEGVAFALRDCIEVARKNNTLITKSNICGGGSKNKAWIKIIANVLNVEIYKSNIESSTAYGAAILAMVGAKKFKTVTEAVNSLIKLDLVCKPTLELTKKYEEKYNVFKQLYPAIKNIKI